MFNATIMDIDNKTVSYTLNKYFQENSTTIMTGADFIKTQHIPWEPWLYAYKRSFLTKNNLQFAEYCRFEDTDFVINCTIHAPNIRFCNIPAYCHTINSQQTTLIGNDSDKITDLFKMNNRLKVIVTSENFEDKECLKTVLNHHFYIFKTNIIRYLWRCSPKKSSIY